MTQKSILQSLLLVALGVCLTLSVENLWQSSVAAERQEAVQLGHPSSFVLTAVGNPQKISYGPDHQIWYYRNDQGELQARYWLNEGLVVRISAD